MHITVQVPELGESVSEAIIGRIHKQLGDMLERDALIFELETDKVAVEVRAPEAGKLVKLTGKEGDQVRIGDVLAEIDPKASEGTTQSSATPSGPDAAKETPSAVPPATMHEVIVPSAGESVNEAQLGQWLKKPGENVQADEPLATLETDKAAMDVGAPVAGRLHETLVSEGETVQVGQKIATITTADDTLSQTPEKAPPTESEAPATRDTAEPGQDKQGEDKQLAPVLSPAPRRLVEEHGLDAKAIKPSGPKGNITKGDVLEHLQEGKKTPPSGKAQERTERVRMTRLRQTIARRLKDAQNTAAILTTFNDVDMSAVMALRKRYQPDFTRKYGLKLGFMSFFVKASVLALREIPEINAAIDGEDIVYRDFYHIGIAVGSDKGLFVPVLRFAESMDMASIEQAIADYGKQASQGRLSLESMQGGTFTISNGGIFGSLLSTPILNPPQSAILGMHRIEERPVVRKGAVVIAPMMYLALSYDHRIVDGKDAVTFLVRIKQCLEDPARMLLGM